MLITDYIEKYYSPVCLEEYKQCLDGFDWFHYMSDSYYPSMDAVAVVLRKLADMNGLEWQKAYNESHSKHFNTSSFFPSCGNVFPFKL